MWTKAFWKGTGERAVKTFFQSFVAVIGVTGIGTTMGLGQVSWVADVSVASLAAILSVATSVGNADFTSGTSSV